MQMRDQQKVHYLFWWLKLNNYNTNLAFGYQLAFAFPLVPCVFRYHILWI